MEQQIISFHHTPIAEGFIFENSNDNAPELKLNRINILVGANNAGKSRFMREIIKLPYIFTGEIDNFYDKISNAITKIKLTSKNYFEIEFLDKGEIIKIDNLYMENFRIALNNILSFELKSLLQYYKLVEIFRYIVNEEVKKGDKNIKVKQKSPTELPLFIGGTDMDSYDRPKGYDFRSDIIVIFDILRESLPVILISRKTYIPTLRSAVTFVNDKKEVFETNTDTKNKDLFYSSVKYNYELDKVEGLDIFTGRDLYETILDSKNGEIETRKKFKEFENFIGETFFGKTIEITSIRSDKHDKKHIKVAFEGEQERELHNYGDGIQTLMLLTYKLFMAQQGEWIFIEEPELNLHPALQREFLRLITEDEYIKAKDLRIFFTTHSNHLLDLTITGNKDISIFVFEREKEISDVKSKSKIREVSYTDLKILHELGVHNSSVFLANCSIWVEGITDRMYVKAYLQAYLKHLEKDPKEPKLNWKEDRHYSFFEYAGSNIVHYDFDNEEESELINAKFLANNVMLIADADMGKEAKHEKFEKQLGDKHYIKLKVREIENLLSAKQLKSALPKLYTTTNDINSDKFEVVEFNEKAYQKIDEKYLRNHVVETLQKYSLQVPKGLNLELDKNKHPVCKTFSSDHKEKLATAVVNDINNKIIKWEDLSKKAQDFTKRIYNFIKEKNQGVIN